MRFGIFIALWIAVTLSSVAQEFPLHLAAEKGDQDGVRKLAAEKSSINQRDEDGHTPLIRAIKHRQLEAAKLLIELGANPRLRSQAGSALMCFAAETGDIALIDLLLDQGLSVNITNDMGGTPLVFAIQKMHLPLMKHLLDHGAIIDTPANHQRYVRQYTPLSSAVVRESWEPLNILMARGADVNVRSLRGFTPLMVAASQSTPERVKYLLDHGADVNATMGGGAAAICFAIGAGKVENMKLLLEAGAGVNPKIYRKQSEHPGNLEWYARKSGDEDLVIQVRKLRLAAPPVRADDGRPDVPNPDARRR